MPGWYDFFWHAYHRGYGASLETLRKRTKYKGGRKARSAERRLRMLLVVGKINDPDPNWATTREQEYIHRAGNP